jgi:hypothetical protein
MRRTVGTDLLREQKGRIDCMVLYLCPNFQACLGILWWIERVRAGVSAETTHTVERGYEGDRQRIELLNFEAPSDAID